MSDLPRTVVVFDGTCVLCNGWVQFLLRHERDHDIHFATSQSQTGLEIAARFGMNSDNLNDSYLVVSDGQPHLKSEAGFVLLKHLRQPFRWLGVLSIIPRPLRDWIYDCIARNRYRWFGRQTCMIIPPEQSHRFLND